MNSKLPHVGTTIFTVMSKLANDHHAINLSQGFPNFPIDAKLQEIYQKTVAENVHQYAPMQGHPLLLEQIQQLTQRNYQRMVSTEKNLLITAGATQAIFTTIQALAGKGDEVILFDPAYDCYDPAIVLAGAVPIHLSLDETFHPDFNELETAINEKTRLIIINTPHNPTGTIWRRENFEKLIQLMNRYPEITLISDEVYEYITYEQAHCSAHHFDELRDRTVVISSFGKTFHVTGWKIGYLIAPDHLMKEIKKVHQFLVFCVNSVVQVTLAHYLTVANVNALGAFYQQKRDFFRELLKETPFEILPCEGTYFQTVSYQTFSEKKDTDFVVDLVHSVGVAAIPLSAFYADGKDRKIIRLCFAKDEKTLQEAGKRLSQL